MQTDYLKYWRVIRYYVKAKYSISTGELDMLLFLYSEDYFSKPTWRPTFSIASKSDAVADTYFLDPCRDKTG